VSAPVIDLTDVDVFAGGRHHAMFTWLRANDPVHWHATADGAGFWALTRYDDIVTAYADHETFSSARGPMLGGSFQSAAVDTAANRMLVASDPPRHRMLRKLVHQVFTPGYVRRIEHQVAVLVDAAIDRALADGGCDVAQDLAPELPAAALMVLAGVSRTEARELITMTRRMIGFRDPEWVDTTGDERLRLALLQGEIFEFFAELLRERRRNPRDDLVSILAAGEVNGAPLPEQDILYNCLNMAVGGNETSSYSAVAGVLAFIEHDEQYRLLPADPGLLDSAVNEVLRWATTNAYVLRVPTRDVELGGRTIQAGQAVTLWNVSANRDESRFPDPESFDVRRNPNRHLAYGAGGHRCIGSGVAQVELRVLFGRLAESRIRLALAGEVVRLRSNFIQGITRLPVRVSC
jgi:cytochrome P450